MPPSHLQSSIGRLSASAAYQRLRSAEAAAPRAPPAMCCGGAGMVIPEKTPAPQRFRRRPSVPSCSQPADYNREASTRSIGSIGQLQGDKDPLRPIVLSWYSRARSMA